MDNPNQGHQAAKFSDLLDAAIHAAPTDTVKELLETVKSIYPAMTNRGAANNLDSGDNGPPPHG